MIEELFTDNNTRSALDYLLNKNSSNTGYDGMTITQLPNYLELNKKALFSSIRDGTYHPGYVTQFDLVGKNGKTRPISKFNTIDRYVAQLVYQVIYPVIDPLMGPESYAYQKGKSVLQAVQACRDHILDDHSHVVLIDFHDFFGTIDHTILKNILDKTIHDSTLTELVMKIVTCDILINHQIHHITRGILQGCSLSPILSNLYLNELDTYIRDLQIPFVRYADDIKLFAKDAEEGIIILSSIATFCDKYLKLTLNDNKSGVFPALSVRYFDYTMKREKNKSIILNRHHRVSQTGWYREWTPNALSVDNGSFHIMEDGILNKKDLTLLFENEDMKQYFPVEAVNEMNVYANMVYSNTLFSLMNQKRVTVNMFDDHGSYIGSFFPASSYSSFDLLVHQVNTYTDSEKRLQYAKIMETAGIRNMMAVLRYYRKHKTDNRLSDTVSELNTVIQKISNATSINDLMMLEAKARQKYYSCFNIILEDSGFVFSNRTRRPPQDAVNAMLSFGNTFLYNRIHSLIQRTRLDERISFIHSATKRTNSLCLGLADIYKPILIDRTVFTMINRKMLDPENDFDHVSDNGIYMTHVAMVEFVKILKTKLSTTVKLSDKTILAYIAVIRDDIRKLARALENDNPALFEPFIQKV